MTIGTGPMVALASDGVLVGAGGREQTRARYPDLVGLAERDGQRLFYEVYGEGEETIFMLATWSLFHSRHWKMQIPYLSRHFRVLVMDGLGNGRSDRCLDPSRYRPAEFARDALAVMDATGTERALTVSLSRGAQHLLELPRLAPGRVVAAAFIGPLFPYTFSHHTVLQHPRMAQRFFKPLPIYLGWGRMNAVHWRESYPEFARWFVSRGFSEGAFDQGHRGRYRVGARHRPRDPDRDRTRWGPPRPADVASTRA